jgi:hypothetical protein
MIPEQIASSCGDLVKVAPPTWCPEHGRPCLMVADCGLAGLCWAADPVAVGQAIAEQAPDF